MKNIKKGMVLLLFLVMGVSWLMMGRHLQAAAESPALEYIYTNGEVIIASVDTEGRSLENAKLTWKDGDGIRSTEALELREGYAAFLTDGRVVPAGELRSLEIQCGGEEYAFDIQAFQAASDTVTASVEEELPVAEEAEQIGEALGEAEEASEDQGSEREILELPQGNGLNGASDEVIVVLDPGHGGSDSGAYRTWDGVKYIEKDIVLKISQYTREELETYAGVRVYLTRESDRELSLEERVDYAASVGASVLISQHINSTPENETTATGAEVMVSKGNYRPSQAEKTAKIARTILAELENIGFSNRDLVYKLSETGNTYPNGKLADYYGIVRRSVLAGFPGMIVEHGFVSNPKDCRAYYGTDARIKKLGIADATAIAKYYGLQKKDMTGWNEEDGRWFYVNADGVRAPEGFLELDGVRYFIGADGYRVTGWQKLSSGKYYFGSDGVMRTGPVNIDGKLYFFGEKGVMSRSFKKGFDGKYYYPRKNGVLHVGWQTINGRKYYFAKKTGEARTGWAKLGKYYYYFTENGRMRKGMVTLEDKTYYLDKSGRRLTGFVNYKDKKYYFNKKTGEMQKKTWVRFKKQWYYIGKNGYALQNTRRRIDGVSYRFDKEGVCVNR